MASAPLRSCIGCRTVRPKAELIRVHAAQGGVVAVDLDGGPGRGAYLCPRRACLEQAVRRGEFSRHLKVALTSPGVGALQELIQERASRKVVSLLGLARRARKVVSGSEAVESAVKRHSARLVLIAADASSRSVGTIRALTARSGIACHTRLAKEELGAAVGGAPRSCVAVIDPHLAGAVLSVLAKIPAETEAGGGPQVEAIDPTSSVAPRRFGGDPAWE